MAERGSHRLSNAFVASLKAPTDRKRGRVFTDPMGGLQIWVSITGAKTWRYSYRPKGRDPVSLTLGRWPDMDAETARIKAIACETERHEYRDPKALVAERRISTVREILESHAEAIAARNPATGRSVKRLYRKLLRAYDYAEPHEFGEALIAYINFWHSGERQQGAARSLIGYVTAAFNRAADPMNGLTLPPGFVNPVKGIAKHIAWLGETPMGSWKVSFDDADLSKLMDALAIAQSMPALHKPGLFALELLLLTGARPSEICSLRDSQIDVSGGVTRIIKNRHKTWKKTGRPREILVMGEALDVLNRAREWRDKNKPNDGDDGFVFPISGTRLKSGHLPRTGHINNLWSYAVRVTELSGVKFVPYNLRSSYINVALDNPPPGVEWFRWLERVAENVGHTNIQTTLGFYRKQKQDALVEAAKHTDNVFKNLRANSGVRLV